MAAELIQMQQPSPSLPDGKSGADTLPNGKERQRSSFDILRVLSGYYEGTKGTTNSANGRKGANIKRTILRRK